MGDDAGMGSPVQSGDAKTCSSRTSQGSSSLYRFAGRMRHAVGGSLQALKTSTTAPNMSVNELMTRCLPLKKGTPWKLADSSLTRRPRIHQQLTVSTTLLTYSHQHLVSDQVTRKDPASRGTEMRKIGSDMSSSVD